MFAYQGEDEVIRHCSNLIQIDTSNPGPGEQRAAEYVVRAIEAAGGTVEIVEPQPHRTSVVSRIAGANQSRPPLLIHAHLDVVPADPSQWIYPPFGGEVTNDNVWGRGALDMKGFAAMMLTTHLHFLVSGTRPSRDLLFAYFADEEMSGVLGCEWMVMKRPDIFKGVAVAVGEGGGFGTFVDGRRVYSIGVGERGLVWLRLSVAGTAGHAALATNQSPITVLAQLVVHLTSWAVASRPPLTLQPTVIRGGHKSNVVPELAQAVIDCRPRPGRAAQTLAEIRSIAESRADIEVLYLSEGLDQPLDPELFEAMSLAIHSEDPGAAVEPYLFPAGTDAARLARLGIRGYGFTPMPLPREFNHWALFHGVDEHVPIDSLVRGQRMLADFVRRY